MNTGIDTSRQTSAARAAGTTRAPAIPTDSAPPRPGALRGYTQEGRAIAIGRDGKPIHRTASPDVDQFALPADLMEKDWSYQWIAETVLNEPQTAQMINFSQNAWQPVPAERWPGRLTPVGTTGPIRRSGLMLVERPKVLTDEAREEEISRAKMQLRTNTEQFMPADSVASRSGLRPTGGIRKGRPVSVAEDGVAPPTLEIADE